MLKNRDKTLRCGDMFEEHAIKNIFIEGLNASIHYSKHSNWGHKSNANLNDILFNGTS